MKVIKDVKLIDGIGDEPIDDVTIVINEDKIESIGTASEILIPHDAEIIDAFGMSLLPGLIDCHDHLAYFGYDISGRWGLDERRSTRHMRVASVLDQTLLSGYTTVRDAGGLDAGFRDAIDQNLITGPRLQVSLSIISPTGGVGEETSISGYTNPAFPDPNVPSGVANGAEEMRKKVREMVHAGADVIKFATTGGASSKAGLGPKDMIISLDEINTLVDEAHHLGKKVMCHALGGPGLRQAIEAGVDSIEHGAYLDEDPDLLEIMLQKDIFFTPTFSVYTFHEKFGTIHGKKRAFDMKKHHIRSVQMALEAGVKIVAGTDAGGWIHGNNAQEITCLTNAGMTSLQAITSATRNAAQCIGLDKEIGTIEVGKKADLILVEGNLLEDVSILEKGVAVKLVMKDGQTYLDHVS